MRIVKITDEDDDVVIASGPTKEVHHDCLFAGYQIARVLAEATGMSIEAAAIHIMQITNILSERNPCHDRNHLEKRIPSDRI